MKEYIAIVGEQSYRVNANNKQEAKDIIFRIPGVHNNYKKSEIYVEDTMSWADPVPYRKPWI